MKSRQLILGILKKGPQTGYYITQMFQTSFAFFFDSSTSVVYPALRRLETEGKVTKETVLQNDHPDKNIFTITATGLAELQSYLALPLEPDNLKSDLLARLIFSEFIGSQTIVSLLQQTIENEKQESALMKSRLTTFQNTDGPLQPAQRLAYEYGLYANHNKVSFFQKWLNEHPDGV